MEHLDDIVMALKASLHPMLRGSLLWHLTTEVRVRVLRLHLATEMVTRRRISAHERCDSW